MPRSVVITDESLISKFDRVLVSLELRSNFVSGLVILALICLAAANVLGRKLFNLPLQGFVDWVEQFLALIAFFGLAYCQREGTHIRMDAVVGRMRGRMLWFAELLGIILILIVAIALAYGSWFHFQRSFDPSAPFWSRDSSIDIGLPLWPAKLIVPLALSLLILRLLLQLWGYCRAFVHNADKPVAVPLIEDVEAQASREAETVE